MAACAVALDVVVASEARVSGSLCKRVRRMAGRLVDEPQTDDTRWAQVALDAFAYDVLRVVKRSERLEAVLSELREAYDDFYATGDNSRLLNVEARARELARDE